MSLRDVSRVAYDVAAVVIKYGVRRSVSVACRALANLQEELEREVEAPAPPPVDPCKGCMTNIRECQLCTRAHPGVTPTGSVFTDLFTNADGEGCTRPTHAWRYPRPDHPRCAACTALSCEACSDLPRLRTGRCAGCTTRWCAVCSRHNSANSKDLYCTSNGFLEKLEVGW